MLTRLPTLDHAIGCEDCRVISAEPTEKGRCPMCGSSSWAWIRQAEDPLALYMELSTGILLKGKGKPDATTEPPC